MKVLISAYACEPGEGSEPGAGWTWVRAAALEHDVWLLTRENNRASIEQALIEEPELHLTPVYLDLPRWALRWKRGQRGVHLYYMLWQWKCRSVAKSLHSVASFDIAHHVTFAVDWMPAGVVGIESLPSIWGPVGGAASLPSGMWGYLGLKASIAEIIRFCLTGIMRSSFGRWTARSASMVVAQNIEVAESFSSFDPVIEPNVALSVPDSRELAAPVSQGSQNRTAIYVGRIAAFKGVLLAVSAIAASEHDWCLRVVGAGPDEERARRIARKLMVSDRVEFVGRIPHSQVAEMLETADVFLFPSMRDAAPWALGEALVAGLPVVCLDLGGPAVLVRRSGGGALVGTGLRVVERLAQALDIARPARSVMDLDRRRLPKLLSSWYESIAG